MKVLASIPGRKIFHGLSLWLTWTLTNKGMDVDRPTSVANGSLSLFFHIAQPAFSMRPLPRAPKGWKLSPWPIPHPAGSADFGASGPQVPGQTSSRALEMMSFLFWPRHRSGQQHLSSSGSTSTQWMMAPPESSPTWDSSGWSTWMAR